MYNWEIDAGLCLVRFKPDRTFGRIALCRGSSLRVGKFRLPLKGPTTFIEIEDANTIHMEREEH
jgi:hypothetical protein